MFDKFTMYVDLGKFTKINEDAFTNANPRYAQTSDFKKQLTTQHPDEYFPRLFLSQSPKMPESVKIEVSLPKLVYGNNLLEVSAGNYERCRERLAVQMSKMGFEFRESALDSLRP